MPLRTVAVISPANIIFFIMIFAFQRGAMPRMLPFYYCGHVVRLNLPVSDLKESSRLWKVIEGCAFRPAAAQKSDQPVSLN